jgi:hypothetical protein
MVMDCVELRSGSPPEETTAAVPLLAEYVRAFCDAEVRRLSLQKEVHRLTLPALDGDEGFQKAWEADMVELLRVIRRLRDTMHDPLSHAERELSRFVTLCRWLPAEKLIVKPWEVRLCLRSFPVRKDGDVAAERASFDVCLAPPESPHFPVYVESYRGEDPEPVFVQPARHGACRGNGAALLETAAEKAALCDLALVALSWARRNLT